VSIRTLIVDDEPLARRAIRRLLARRSEVEIVAECGDGESAVQKIWEAKLDLVFLDIQMPELDGFQVMTAVGAERMPVTVFVTAYDRFALRAFDADAIDYLLKPVSKERFERAFVRAQQRIAGKLANDDVSRLLTSLKRLETTPTYLERLAIPQDGRIRFILTSTIDWIEAEGNYVRIHIGKHAHEFRETLTELEQKLCPDNFLRIHRSTIVNADRIREIQPWFHGHHRVLLVDGTELRMSRYQRDVARRLGLT
jgi:two-component system, LytTR family, response regulator